MQLSSDTNTRTLQLVEAIARQLGILPPLPGEPMADVTKSIGTSSRDYSTITAWEADWDNGGIYSASDVAIGEMYDDSAFDEAPTFDGGGTVGLSGWHLTAATGQQHDGTAGSGARIVRTGTGGITFTVGSGQVSWIEIDLNGNLGPAIDDVRGTGERDEINNYHHNIFHGVSTSSGSGNAEMLIAAGNVNSNVYRNIVYDLEYTGGGGVFPQAISMDGRGTSGCYNNTVYGVAITSGTADAIGINVNDESGAVVTNNIAANVTTAGAGSAYAFYDSSYTTGTAQTNASDDSTAPAPIGAEPITAADEFVSVTGGSEDFHLKTGADSIDAGTDLGTTPTGVELDIDGRNCDTEGDTWDLGAHEFPPAAGGGTILPFMMQLAN